jgi:hypothetical protein
VGDVDAPPGVTGQYVQSADAIADGVTFEDWSVWFSAAESKDGDPIVALTTADLGGQTHHLFCDMAPGLAYDIRLNGQTEITAAASEEGLLRIDLTVAQGDLLSVTPCLPCQSAVLAVDRTSLAWTEVIGATAYDVVRGSLGELRASAGDFTPSVDQCLADDHASVTLDYAEDPPPGTGHWILVRGDAVSSVGTYESLSETQVGLRDEEIGASALACP